MMKLGPLIPAILLLLTPPATAQETLPPGSMHYTLPDSTLRAAQESPTPLTPPSGSEIACPGEFCRADGCFLTYETQWGSTQILMDIAYEVAREDTVYMLVKNSSDMNDARNLLIANGVDIDHVRFIYYPQLSENCIWVRDYGPVYIYEDGAKAIVDFWYPFTNDDDVPITIGAEFGLPVYTSDLLYSLGNFMTDGNGMGFCTSIVYSYNPAYTQAQVRQIFSDYCGLDSLVVLGVIDVENTKHIDVFCKLVDDTTFIVGEYERPEDGAGNNYYILNDIAAYLDGLRNLHDRDFNVVRIPMPAWESGGSSGVTRTYTNSLIINDKILIPVYGTDLDEEAIAVYESLCPKYEVIGINSEQIIHRAGAVHCITKLHHSDNPLIVFHNRLTALEYGEAPAISFTVNPKFASTQASVFYRPKGDPGFVEVAAGFHRGVWTAALPEMEEDFDYYVAGTATSGSVQMDVTLPAGAPLESFFVDVEEATGVASADGTGETTLSVHGYPNPFRSFTEIRFAVPGDRAARLTIYNILGRVVRTFPEVERGRDRVRWDGRSDSGEPVGVGVYLCVLEAGSETATAKLLFLR